VAALAAVAVTVVRRRRFGFINKAAAARNASAAAEVTQALFGEDAVEAGAEGAVGACLAPLEDGGCGRGAELDVESGCCACTRPIPSGGVCPRGFYAGERCCLQCARPVPGDGVCPAGMQVSEGCCVRRSNTQEEVYGELAADFAEEAVVMLAADKVMDMVGRKVFKETIEEGSKRAVSEAADKAAKKAFKEAMEKGTTEGLEEAVEEGVTEAAEKAGKNAVSKTVGKKAAQEAAERAAKEAIEAGAEAVIKESMDKAAKKAAKKAIKDLGKQATKEAIEKAVKEAAEKAAKEAGERAVKEIGAKLGREVAEKAASTMATKAGTSIAAKSAAAATKTAITTAKVGKAGAMAARGMAALTKLTNPLTAVFVVFDLASLTVDLLDVSGYANFTANAVNENARNVAEMSAQDMCLELKIDYPQLFPPELAFPDEWAGALTAMQSVFITEAIAELLDKVEAVETDDAPEIQEDEVVALCEKLINKDPKRRDKLIYDALVDLLSTGERKYVQLYSKLSTKTRIAVSFSKEGVDWWNNRYKSHWFDLFREAEGTPKPLAMYSRKYRVLAEPSWFDSARKNRKAMEAMKNVPSFGGGRPPDVGTLENPKVKEKTLSESAPLALNMGPTQNLMAMCEAHKNEKNIFGGTVNDGVDPQEFGVTFDPTTGTCKYTRSYCERFALDFQNAGGKTDCVPYPGQDVAELIFGTELTRAFVSLGQDFEKAFGTDLMCDEKTEDQFGLGCWKKPKQGWSWTTPGIAGSEFMGLDCPSFSNTLAAHCHYDRGAGVAQELSPCPANTRDIGTDCYYYSQDRGTTFRDDYYANGDHYGKDDYYKSKPRRFSTTTHSKKNTAYSSNNGTYKKNPNWFTAAYKGPCSYSTCCYEKNGKKKCTYKGGYWYAACSKLGSAWKNAKQYSSGNCVIERSAKYMCESRHGKGNCEEKGGYYYEKCSRKHGSGWRMHSSNGYCQKTTYAESECKSKTGGTCFKDGSQYVERCPSGYTYSSYSGQCYVTDPQKACESNHGKGNCEKGVGDGHWYKKCKSGYSLTEWGNCNNSAMSRCEKEYGPDSSRKGLHGLSDGSRRGCEVFKEAGIDYVYPKCERLFGSEYSKGKAHHTICYPNHGEVRAKTLTERMHCKDGKTTKGGGGLCYPPAKEVAVRGKKTEFTCRETSCELSREIHKGEWSQWVHTCHDGYTKLGSRCYRNEHLEEAYGPEFEKMIEDGAIRFGAGAGKAWDYAKGAATSAASTTSSAASGAASSAGSFASGFAGSFGR